MRERAPSPTDLDVCAACRQPFVAPTALVDRLADQRYAVRLTCTNCGWSEVAVHPDAELALLDRRVDEATRQIAAAADVLALTADLERIDAFAAAIEQDLILPEDF